MYVVIRVKNSPILHAAIGAHVSSETSEALVAYRTVIMFLQGDSPILMYTAIKVKDKSRSTKCDRCVHIRSSYIL